MYEEGGELRANIFMSSKLISNIVLRIIERRVFSQLSLATPTCILARSYIGRAYF